MNILVIGDANSTHVLKRTAALQECGANCVIMSPNLRQGGAPDNVVVPIFECYLPWPFSRYRSLFDLWSEIRFIRNQPYDLVLVHFGASRLAWLASIFSKKPVGIVAMGGDVLFNEQAQLTPAEAELTCATFREADFVVAKSPYLAGKLVELDVSDENIYVSAWGVDPKVFNDNLDNDFVGGDAVKKSLNVISPRILQPFYNIEKIILSMVKVRAEIEDVNLLITEYQPDFVYKEYLVTLVEKNNLGDCVHFIGEQSPQAMAKILKKVDLSVSVPPSDGLPMTVLEAMACGTPNVVSKLPHYQGIFIDSYNVVVSDTNPDDIAKCIIRILTDKDFSDAIRENGKDFINKNSTLPNEASKVFKIINNILVKNKGRERRVNWKMFRVFLATIWPRLMPSQKYK